jgi:hypothetical protein
MRLFKRKGFYIIRHLFLTITFAVLIQGCSSNEQNQQGGSGYFPETGIKRVMLEQGWDKATRQLFWFTSQGSRILPINWFRALEQVDNQALFLSTEHMDSLGYLPQVPSSYNPAGLPIGFALDRDNKTKTSWVGLTCAACHTNQIDYQGEQILIEGAPTLANFELFYNRLVESLHQTLNSPEKYKRFAQRVLQANYNPKNSQQLLEQLTSATQSAELRKKVNALPASFPQDFAGFGRLDAFGNIQNAASALALHNPNNASPPNAPVSYPFLWGTHQSNVVQWNGSANNRSIIGPLSRNVGEVIGVFGGLNISKGSSAHAKIKYSSSVDLKALGKLEKWVKALRAPIWDSRYFPAIDQQSATTGELIYQEQCETCHQVIPRDRDQENYIAQMIPLAEIGTDPSMARNAVLHVAQTGILEGTKDRIIGGAVFPAQAPAIKIAVNGVLGVILGNLIPSLKASQAPNDKSIANDIALMKRLKAYLAARSNIANKTPSSVSAPSGCESVRVLCYKARPLNGIWATAPYLHNGSVANLWQLLMPDSERLTEFWVGSRQFDPFNVGFVTDKGLSKLNVLTQAGEIQQGNSNRGHNYGTELSAKKKRQLIEYLKTL